MKSFYTRHFSKESKLIPIKQLTNWIIVLFLFVFSNNLIGQTSSCNIQASICQPGVTNSFPFISTAAGPPFDYVNPQGCGTGEHGADFGFGFVLLHITTSGPLNLQIMGNVPTGHLDFVVYNIPQGISPCTAVLDSNNQIACNFSTQSVGCTQFGNACTGCPSIVAAPYVYAGQEIMIITHDYDDVLTSFTLELCPGGAGTGSFDASINPPPPLTDTSSVFTLSAATGGGSWSASCGGCINSNNGQFNPVNAGVGTHEIIYSIGNSPCDGHDTIQLVVEPHCQLTLTQGNEVCDIAQNTFIAAEALGVFPVQYIWSDFPAGDTLQIITADSTTSFYNSVDTLFNITSGTYILDIITADGCTNSKFVNLNLTPVLDSIFTYNSNIYCINGSSSLSPDFIASPSNTNFFVTQPNIVVNEETGIIDLTQTSIGSYTIYNQPNSCSGIGSFDLVIAPAEDPSFFLLDTICAFTLPGLVLPFDSIATPGNGYFWASDSNLVFTDSVNGLVNWQGAKKDTITTIYYNTGGFCPEIDSAKIYVKQLSSFFTYENYELCVLQVSNVFPDSIHTQTGSLLTSYFYCDDPNLILDSLTGEIDASGSAMGSYDVIRVVNDVCIDSTIHEIRITDHFDPYFSYPVSQECQFAGIISPDTVAHGGGEFTATPSGLAIDPQSGSIDLDLSNFGVYDIRYITPGICGDTSYLTFEVLEVPDADFSYPATLFCDMTGTILPSYVATSGGVFSSSTGLAIDPSTGEIDFDNSHEGTYSISHTTTGACILTYILPITISSTYNPYFTYAQASYCKNNVDPIPDSLASTGGSFTATPSGLVINSLTGLIDLSASAANIYSIRYVTSGQCKDTAYFTLEVLSVPSSNFGYPSFTYCDAAATGVISPTFVDTPGGSFTSTVGLSLNSSTGEIDLDASTNGLYTINYTTTGVCPDVTSQNFTIGNTPSVTFSYASTTYCKNEPYPYPNFNSNPGGTYSSSSPYLYISSTTGMIYLYYCLPGTYTITYTSPGACGSSSTFDVTIMAAPTTTFSYPQSYYCSYNGVISPSIMPSITGGTFSSAAGLAINSTTGAIDFSSSTPGTYIIYYTTTGVCPTIATYTMSVHPSICNCNASIPLFEARINGLLTDVNDIKLCYGDTLEIKPEQGSSWLPQPIYPGSTVPYSPQLGMDIYHCQPNNFAPNDLYTGNTCFTGLTPTKVGHSWTLVNDINTLQPYVNSIDDTLLYLVPFTKYNTNTVTVYNTTLGNRCYAVGDIQVKLLPEIRNTFTENCLDSSVILSVNGGLPSADGSNFTISNIIPSSAIASSNQFGNNSVNSIYPIDPLGGYGFTVMDTTGCNGTFYEPVFIGTPSADAGLDTIFCDLLGITNAIYPSFGYGYWIPPSDIQLSDSSLNNQNFIATQTGAHSLIWITETNQYCRDRDTVIYYISDIDYVTNITETFCYALEGVIDLEAVGGFSPYQYSIDNGISYQANNVFDSLDTGTYQVIVKDAKNCFKTSVVVIELSDPCSLVFYSGITPNGDGINDSWFIEGLPTGNYPCTIFNRWGDIVWSTSSYDNFTNSWKGINTHGEELPTGVYYYSIGIFEQTFTGFIELTR